MSGDLGHSVMIDSDDEDGCPSSPGSMHYEDSGDLMSVAMGDEVTAQLAAAGWHTIHGDVLFLLFLLVFRGGFKMCMCPNGYLLNYFKVPVGGRTYF